MDGDSSVYKTLLESTKAIPWKIDWETLTFAYIGPQIETLLGWPQSSWVGFDDWASRMHPDDRDRVVGYCVSQSRAGVDHQADYRALTQDGRYVWMRDVVHVVRKEDGSVDSLIGFMFDITEQKAAELKIVQLQRELEALSFKDGLTNIANRRMFDSILEMEWEKARRNSQALSLIMVDIDHFKQYNDHYGHVQGDECLKRVARVLSGVATRSRDFLARYGGEEFVFVLPETTEASAYVVAERCRRAIREEAIPHERSPLGRLLTISLGVGSIVPSHGDSRVSFVEEVDERLYRAKQDGRDRAARREPPRAR